MDAGLLREIVYFEAKTITNVSGEVTETWVDQSGNSPPTPDYAQVISQKGGEAFNAARTQSNRIIRIQVRFRDDVLSTWRIKWEGEYYNIIDIDRSARMDGALWLTAQTGVAA